MPYFDILLQKNLHHPQKLLQIHSLLITTTLLTTTSTTFSYNCLIKCHPNATLHLYTQMLSLSLHPNSHTFPPLLKSPLSLFSYQSIHTHILHLGLILDNFTNCSLIDAYARCGLLSDARKVFDEIRCPDLASCNSMLNALCINGDVLSALEYFESLHVKDVITWTTMINGFVKGGRVEEAVRMFRRLMFYGSCYRRLRPNEATLVSLFSACANSSDSLHKGKEIHAHILRHEIGLTPFLGTALVYFYGKHGLLSTSTNLFELIENKEVCTWNAMISTLASNREEIEAINLFKRMQSFSRQRPNHITLVVVLTACARKGLVDLGLRLFDSVSKQYGIVPRMEHYGCVVDLLSRAGRLRAALEFIRNMPIVPDASVLGALLGACRIHGDVELGSAVGRKLMAMQPLNSGRYVALSNVCAEAERWTEAEEWRKQMGRIGVKKIVGCSWL